MKREYELAFLKHLKFQRYLYSNSISGSLPSSIGKLTNLKSLYVSMLLVVDREMTFEPLVKSILPLSMDQSPHPSEIW